MKMPKTTYYALLKIDTPDFELSLKRPALMKTSYGRNQLVDTVVFRSDEPLKMIEKLQSKSAYLSDL